MAIKQVMRIKWTALKRIPVFYAILLINYGILSFVDTKTVVFMQNEEQYIFRFLFQQFFIVFDSLFIVNLIFNERTLYALKNYNIIYLKNIKTELLGTFLFICVINIGAFLFGQSVVLLINYLYYGTVNITLFLVNFIMVSLEIIICTLLIMSLRLLLIKDIIVFGLFFLTIFTSMVINNVFVSIPLTIKIVGIEEQAYYVTYGAELWIGRSILLLLGTVLYLTGMKRFELSIIDI